jgi:hypothetical protein
VHVKETGDHLGRKGLGLGGGVGLVVGLFAPPLLAATAVGAAAGGVVSKFAKHRLEGGIAEKMDGALPPASGGVIAVYDSDGADAVDKALANAVKKSVAQIDGLSAKNLKAGLAHRADGCARRRSRNTGRCADRSCTGRSMREAPSRAPIAARDTPTSRSRST